MQGSVGGSTGGEERRFGKKTFPARRWEEKQMNLEIDCRPDGKKERRNQPPHIREEERSLRTSSWRKKPALPERVRDPSGGGLEESRSVSRKGLSLSRKKK